MALTNGVINWSLSVSVLSVHIVLPLINEELNGKVVALARCIEDWSLLQRVISEWAYAHLSEHFDHLEGQLVILNDARREKGRLAEFVLLVDHHAWVNIIVTDHLDNIFDLTAFDPLKEVLVE